MNQLLLPAIIRQTVPAIVGVVTAVVFKHFGVVLSDQASVELTAGFTSLVTVAYYVGVRLAAKKWPGAEKFLLNTNVPLYATRRR